MRFRSTMSAILFLIRIILIATWLVLIGINIKIHQENKHKDKAPQSLSTHEAKTI